MPCLSFPCTISQFTNARLPSLRRTWIKSHDLRGLACAAAEQIAARPDDCEYTLFAADIAPPGVFLEVHRSDRSALVGPMAGPAPSADVDPKGRYTLEDLLTRLGLGREAAARASRGRAEPDGSGQFAYPVIVTYNGIWYASAYPPQRKPSESDLQFLLRQESADRMRIERARHEGVHVVRYDVAPWLWTAGDLERLLGLAYRLLPQREPRWRDSGAITQRKFADPADPRVPRLGYSLEVARGDYAAQMRLPCFPTLALAEWLADRRCDITLCHPIVKIEAVARAYEAGRLPSADVLGLVDRTVARSPEPASV